MRVNGKEVSLGQPLLLAAYLENNGFRAERIVVERNGIIVSREHFATTELADSDKLEIVHFVGGG